MTLPQSDQPMSSSRPHLFGGGLVGIVAGVIYAVLMICISVAVIVLAFNNSNQASRVASVSTAEHASQIANCQLSNVNRKRDIAVWNYVDSTFGGPKSPPAVRAVFTKVEALVKVKDTLQDCAAVYSTK